MIKEAREGIEEDCESNDSLEEDSAYAYFGEKQGNNERRWLVPNIILNFMLDKFENAKLAF